MSFALYAASVIKKSPANLAFPGHSKCTRQGGRQDGPREARRGGFCNDFAKTFVLDSGGQRGRQLALLGSGGPWRLRSSGIVLRRALRQLSRGEPQAGGRGAAQSLTEALAAASARAGRARMPTPRTTWRRAAFRPARSAPATRCGRSARPCTPATRERSPSSLLPARSGRARRCTSSPIRSGFISRCPERPRRAGSARTEEPMPRSP